VYININYDCSLDISVGIEKDHRLVGRGSIPGDFSLNHSFKIEFVAHPVFYCMGTGAVSPRVKRPGCEARHSSPTSAEIKNDGAIPPLHP
jgi:hypothetical protein